ncbi:hypothetical protein B0H13DRAFT_1879620 [Mycena leptocephala]|nr:hypothetical protein B0H13DRAFT_1879620 [Mycena leptocephala]
MFVRRARLSVARTGAYGARTTSSRIYDAPNRPAVFVPHRLHFRLCLQQQPPHLLFRPPCGTDAHDEHSPSMNQPGHTKLPGSVEAQSVSRRALILLHEQMARNEAPMSDPLPTATRTRVEAQPEPAPPLPATKGTPLLGIGARLKAAANQISPDSTIPDAKDALIATLSVGIDYLLLERMQMVQALSVAEGQRTLERATPPSSARCRPRTPSPSPPPDSRLFRRTAATPGAYHCLLRLALIPSPSADPTPALTAHATARHPDESAVFAGLSGGQLEGTRAFVVGGKNGDVRGFSLKRTSSTSSYALHTQSRRRAGCTKKQS